MPFLDRELVEFCLALPRGVHGREGWDRWVMREAMAERLPPAVRWRRGKTDYGPSVNHGRRRELAALGTVADATPRLWRYVDRTAWCREWEAYQRQPDGGTAGTLAGHRLWRVALLAAWLQSPGA